MVAWQKGWRTRGRWATIRENQGWPPIKLVLKPARIPTLPVGGILMTLLVVRRFLVVTWAAMAILIGFAPSEAQEWTRFRGPNGTGQSDATTIPAEWTDKDYNWKIELPGVGHGS